MAQFNLTIQPQPFSLTFDMTQVEKYDEATKELTLFNIETKSVSENIGSVEFTTQKSYDKKYVIGGFDDNSGWEQALIDLASGGSYVDMTVSGSVTSNTDATLKASIDTLAVNPIA